MNRRQLLIGSGATCLAGVGAVTPFGFAQAASPGPGRAGNGAPIRQSGFSAELGGVVLGSYQLHTLSISHHTIS